MVGKSGKREQKHPQDIGQNVLETKTQPKGDREITQEKIQENNRIRLNF